MARLRKGIGSMLSGKAAGMVFVQLDSETYMRVVPNRKKNSWTPKQLLHRKRFKLVNSFCTQFRSSVIPLIWNPMAKKMAGYALFFKANIPAFGLDGSLADPKMLQFSTGKTTIRLPRLSQSKVLLFQNIRNRLRHFSIDIQHFKTREAAPEHCINSNILQY